jgi:purine nucleosidase
LIDPSLFEARRCHVRVIDDGGPLDGFTNVDWWHKDQRSPNCDWIHTANAAGFYDLLCDRLARFSC